MKQKTIPIEDLKDGFYLVSYYPDEYTFAEVIVENSYAYIIGSEECFKVDELEFYIRIEINDILKLGD